VTGGGAKSFIEHEYILLLHTTTQRNALENAHENTTILVAQGKHLVEVAQNTTTHTSGTSGAAPAAALDDATTHAAAFTAAAASACGQPATRPPNRGTTASDSSTSAAP
jgi:hypothetical protein